MQTIARANRVADEGKKNGLIVDYIGVFKNIERALALYAASGVDEDEIIKSKDELLNDLNNTLNKVKEFLGTEQIEMQPLLEAPSDQKLLLLEKYANIIIGKQEKKKKFKTLPHSLTIWVPTPSILSSWVWPWKKTSNAKSLTTTVTCLVLVTQNIDLWALSLFKYFACDLNAREKLWI